ncbi:MAG: hypothetical protein HY608_04650, partial [Planctomycetes bacterium]|nr:hypothetical protein [Planctomycetota bacterium]
SLVAQAVKFFGSTRDAATGALLPIPLANGIVSILFLALALFLVVEAARAIGGPSPHSVE